MNTVLTCQTNNGICKKLNLENVRTLYNPTIATNVPSKSSLSVRGMEGRLRGRLKARIYLLVVNTYEVRGRTEVLRGRAA